MSFLMLFDHMHRDAYRADLVPDDPNDAGGMRLG